MIGRYVLRNLLRHKTRTVMGVLGMIVTLTLLTAVQVTLDSVARSFIDLTLSTSGTADIVIQEGEHPNAIQPLAFEPGELPAKLAAIPELEGAVPRLIARLDVDGRFITVVGIDPAEEVRLGLQAFVPWPELAPGTCSLSVALAGKLGAGPVSIGGLSLPQVATFRQQMLFGGVYRDIILMDLPTARRALGLTSEVSQYAAKLKDAGSYYDPTDIAGTISKLQRPGRKIAAALGPRFSVAAPRAQKLGSFEAIGGPLRAGSAILLAASLGITALLLYSLLSVSAEERAREHAVLRVVGARRGYVFRLVLSESLVLCMFGVVPGGVLGVVGARLLVRVVEQSFGGTTSIPIRITAGTVALPILAGTLVALASALVPALRSMRMRMIDGLDPMRRQGAEAERTERSPSALLVTIGAALSAGSGLVFFVLPSAYLSNDTSLMGAVAAGLLVAMLAGFSLVGLGALPLIEQGVLAPFMRVFGTAADLAGKNIARYRRRNTTTSLMFAVSITFVVFVTSLAAIGNQTVSEVVEQQTGADMRVQMFQSDHLDLEGPLRQVEGVREIARVLSFKPQSEAGLAYSVVASDLIESKPASVTVFGVQDRIHDVLYRERIACEEGNAKLAFQALADDTGAAIDDAGAPVIVSLALAKSLDLHAGDLLAMVFRLGGQARDVRVRIAAICSAMPGFTGFRLRASTANGSGVLFSARTFGALTTGVDPGAFTGFYLVGAEGDTGAVAARLRDELSIRHSVLVTSTEEQKRTTKELFWSIQGLSLMLLLGAISIAAFGLIASMATSVVERRWEIGVLQAVGMRRGGIFRMFALEAVALTMSSGIVGVVMGFALAWLLAGQAGAFLGLGVSVALPWLTIGATLGVCVASGVLAAFVATRRVLKKTVAEVLAD